MEPTSVFAGIGIGVLIASVIAWLMDRTLEQYKSPTLVLRATDKIRVPR